MSFIPTPVVTSASQQQLGSAALSAGAAAAAGAGSGAVGEDDPSVQRNLFVANLSYDVDDALFRSVFEKFGEIRSAKVMLDIHSGISRGFGFVMYVDDKAAVAAMDALQGQPIGQRQSKMSISWAKTSGKSAVTATTKLYVRNVPRAIDEATLMALFSKFGRVVRSVPKEDTADRSTIEQRGGAAWAAQCCVIFLEYSTVAEADAAVNGIHNTRPWPNMVVPLMAKTAETAEMRNIRKMRQSRQQQQQQQQQQQHSSTSPGAGGGHPLQPPPSHNQAFHQHQQLPSPPPHAMQMQHQHQQHQQQQQHHAHFAVHSGGINGATTANGGMLHQQAFAPQFAQQQAFAPTYYMAQQPGGGPMVAVAQPMWNSQSASMSASWGPNQFGQLLPLPSDSQPQPLVVVPAGMIFPSGVIPGQQVVIAQPPGQFATQYCVLPPHAPPLFDQSLDQSVEHILGMSGSPKVGGGGGQSRSRSPQRPQSPLVPSLPEH